MKKNGQLIYIATIFILLVVIIFQFRMLKRERIIQNDYQIPFSILDDLTEEKKSNLSLYYYNKEKGAYGLIDRAQYIEKLGKYCWQKGTKDSVDKYIEIASSLLSVQFDNSLLYRNLYSKDEEKRKYSSKLLEYFIVGGIINDEESADFQFKEVMTLLCANSHFKDDTLNLGEDFECVISLATGSFKNPVRIKIEGEDEIVLDDNLYTVYKRPSLKKGEHEIKGEIIYSHRGREMSFDFSQKYWVK